MSDGIPLYLFDVHSIIDADLAWHFDGKMPDFSLWNGIRVWDREVEGETYTDKLFNMFNPAKVTWYWLGSAQELAIYIKELGRAVKAPIHAEMREALDDCLELAREEARRRLRVLEARQSRGDRYPAWEDADLVAEVVAVCGPGRRVGRQWVFRCPFHEDRHPSLSVNADRRLWHCFPCSRGGGVVDWRKAIEAAA